MIRKTSNTYKQIKLNIGMLTLIQQATGISPNRLANIFIKNIPEQDLFIKKRLKTSIGQLSFCPMRVPTNTSNEPARHISTRLSQIPAMKLF